MEERILAYFDYCFSYALFLSKNPEDAKEIVQEVAAKIWRAAPAAEFLGEKYFRRAVFGVFANRVRNNLTIYSITDEDEFYTEGNAEAHAVNSDMIDRARKVIDPTDFRFITLSADGYSHSEIASIEGVTKSHVSSRIKIARSKAQAIAY
jgi:RNA polymerase sigma factor (sigma-70 family)